MERVINEALITIHHWKWLNPFYKILNMWVWLIYRDMKKNTHFLIHLTPSPLPQRKWGHKNLTFKNSMDIAPNLYFKRSEWELSQKRNRGQNQWCVSASTYMLEWDEKKNIKNKSQGMAGWKFWLKMSGR